MESPSIVNPPPAEVYYPRDSTDATLVFDTLRQWLPSELALQILEQARYWLQARIARKDSVSYDEADCHDRIPYLTSEPVQGDRFPVREIQLSIHSHDQGWSDHYEDHGTFQNSWTWFDLGIRRSDGGDASDEIIRLATNAHARWETFHHELLYRSDRDSWVRGLQPGDQLRIIPRARFPGWENFVEGASIVIYTAAGL